ALAPMTRISATEDGRATEEMARYYVKFARGGYSLLITEGTYIDETYSQGYRNQPGITNHSHVQSWRKVTDAVHSVGGHIIMQLMHAGALSQGNYYKIEKIAPSAIKPKGEQLEMYSGHGSYSVPREITKGEIRDVIGSFVESAKRAREAGFDGVEIHGANGYILDQFLTDYANQRTDEYGGSVENRIRLNVEILQEIRKEMGSDFIVGIRISQAKVNDYYHKWAGGEADAEVIFKSIANAGADFIHVTENDISKPAFNEGPNLSALAKKYGGVLVIANGNLEDPGKAEAILSKRETDIISLGKGALANPDWPKRVLEGKPLNEFDSGILQPIANIKEKELDI
ncbi:MAG: NADH:flavin oxidoreductase, partial [Bacilli bacterium]